MNAVQEKIADDCTIRRCDKLMGRFRHWHQRMEFVYLADGVCDFEINGKHYTGASGDLFVVHSGEIHNISSYSGACIYICTFQPAILNQFCTEAGFVQNCITADELKEAKLDEAIHKIFGEMYSEKVNNERYSNEIIKINIVKLYCLLIRYFETETVSDKKDIKKFMDFQTVLSYITNNFSENITLNDVAEQISYSPAYTSTLFVTYTGVNFKNYLDSIRIYEAVKLIKNTNRTITQISTECGFDNIRTFNNTFKRVTGLSPSKLRQKNI